MTRPTDDELEAMAGRLDQSDANEYSYDNDKEDAAAMLRACKVGDVPDRTQWNAAIEAAKKLRGDYHWNRYRTRDQGGELHYPAVFTSHTHQEVQEALDTLKKGHPHD